MLSHSDSRPMCHLRRVSNAATVDGSGRKPTATDVQVHTHNAVLNVQR